MRDGFYVAVIVDAECLRHLPIGRGRLLRRGQRGRRGLVAGLAGLIGDGIDSGLQRDQRVHVVLIGRRDVAVGAAGRYHGLHRLEDIGRPRGRRRRYW